jgi:chromate transporter
MDPFVFFWLVLRSSFFSTSGLGNLPQLYADLTARGWATETTFGEALAVGQITPGPSGLWVISLGYLIDGPRGALLTTLAISVPPVAVLLIDRLYKRVDGHPAVQGFVDGLGLAVVGTFLVTMAGLVADGDLSTLLVIVGAFGLAATGRVPVIVILAVAAVVGILVY